MRVIAIQEDDYVVVSKIERIMIPSDARHKLFIQAGGVIKGYEFDKWHKATEAKEALLKAIKSSK